MNLPKRNLHKQVVEALGQHIITGHFEVGQTLPTADDLSDELGVSRTVTREAIKVLEEKGLLHSRPKAGIQVQPTSQWKLLDHDVMKWHYQEGDNPAFVRQLMQVRRIIEPAASELAALHATPEELHFIQTNYQTLAASVHDLAAYKKADQAFHGAIFAATHNPLLAYLGQTINIDLDAGRDLTATIPRSLAESLPLHQQLTHALLAQDSANAYAITVALVDQITQFIEEALQIS